jgi:hypothetical protein
VYYLYLIYIFTLDFPWVGKCCVLSLLDLYIYFGFPLARLKWRILLKSVRLPLHTLRHSSSYHVTTGGPRCPGTLKSMLKYGTCATGLSYNTDGEFHPTETPNDWWDIISVKFIVELPQVHNCDVIMAVIDSVTKCMHFIPTHTRLNVEGTVRLYLKEAWKQHGPPHVVLSDWGPQCITEFTCEVYWQLGIKLAMLTEYYP